MSRHWKSVVLLAAIAALCGACTARTSNWEPTPAVASATLPGAASMRGGTVEGVLETYGARRTYRLYIPQDIDPAGAALVVALHGGGGNAANLERTVGLNAVAEREGFLVVYPNGSGRLDELLLTWNAGNCCGYALDEQVDDVAFIRALVEELAKTYAIDRQRVYATGMSNGGMMSYRLACEAADLFAAVAPVAGALNVEGCEPSEPVSVLAIHGTADQHVLFEGGVPNVQADSHARTDRSVHYATTFWAAVDRCHLEPEVSQSGGVIHETWQECDAGLAVELFAIEGGGHAWPGAVKFSPQGDEPSQALDASEAMWAFFEAHPKP